MIASRTRGTPTHQDLLSFSFHFHFPPMPTRRLSFLLLLTILCEGFFAGCTTDLSQANPSSIPQSRPASWEGGIPGMSNLPGPGGH